MKIVTADEVDALLDPRGLADAIGRAFAGDIVVPVRHHHDIERHGDEATLLLMPAWTGADFKPSFFGTKLVSIFRNNAARGLPSVLGSYLLNDGTSGLPLAAIDGARLTTWRTAAASAYAARFLARPDARRLVMVGAGALSPFLVKAHAAERDLTDIVIWNHNGARAVALAGELARTGLPVRASTDLEAAVREADIVSCATLSVDPLVRGEWLRPGTHLDCVGAFKPGMRETDDDCVRRASLFCDTRAGAMKEGGDLAIPLATGLIGKEHVRADLFDLARGIHKGRAGADEITLFKSVGTAIEDLAAAMLVWERLARTA